MNNVSLSLDQDPVDIKNVDKILSAMLQSSNDTPPQSSEKIIVTKRKSPLRTPLSDRKMKSDNIMVADSAMKARAKLSSAKRKASSGNVSSTSFFDMITSSPNSSLIIIPTVKPEQLVPQTNKENHSVFSSPSKPSSSEKTSCSSKSRTNPSIPTTTRTRLVDGTMLLKRAQLLKRNKNKEAKQDSLERSSTRTVDSPAKSLAPHKDSVDKTSESDMLVKLNKKILELQQHLRTTDGETTRLRFTIEKLKKQLSSKESGRATRNVSVATNTTKQLKVDISDWLLH